MHQIRSAQIVTHRRAGACRVHIRRSAARLYVIDVYGAEINTESRTAGCVGHARVHLCSREQENAPRRCNHADLWVELHRLFWLGLLPRVFLDELSRILSARTV